MIEIHKLPEIESNKNLDRVHRAVKANAHSAFHHQRERDRLQQKLTTLEQENPFLTQQELSRETMSWLLFFYVLATLGLDFALSNNIVPEIAGGSSTWILLVVIPVMLVMAEVTVSMCRYLKRLDPSLFSVAPAVLTLFGVGIALVMPAMVLATRVAEYLGEESPSRSFLLITALKAVALTALSLVLHGLLLANGRNLYEAYVFLFGTRRHRALQNRIRRITDAYNQALSDTWDSVIAYDGARRRHVAHGFQAPAPPVFDAATRQVLDVIQRQGGNAAPGAGNPDGNGGGAAPPHGSNYPQGEASGATAPPPPEYSPADDEVVRP